MKSEIRNLKAEGNPKSEIQTPSALSFGISDFGFRTSDFRLIPARYVPLIIWVIVFAVLFGIGLRIGSYGYVPGGDARRHVAMAVNGKSYSDVLVLRPGYFMTNSPGWEWLLRFLHRNLGWGIDALTSFSLLSMLTWLFCAPLPWLRRPEAWLAALLVEMVAEPFMVHHRFAQGRPFLLTEGILIGILFAWSRNDPKGEGPSWPKILLTSLAFAFSVFMHGLWYMWVLPLAAFFLARQWRTGLWLSGCLVVGIVSGSLMTGHPIDFLKQALFIASTVSRQKVEQWMLVGELCPYVGHFATLMVLALVFLWRKKLNVVNDRFSSLPALWLIALAGLLGFKADRFWADWGMPAVLVWLTMQFEAIAVAFSPSQHLKRLATCALIALPCFLVASNDPDERYSANLRYPAIDATDPALKEWLPAPGGIFYSAEMGFFYNTFYKNPDAPWRYILGLEPALMPEDDLKILRRIQFNYGAAKAYEPWVAKMRPIDRLAIEGPSKPELPQLEWTNAVGQTWVGRLPGDEHR